MLAKARTAAAASGPGSRPPAETVSATPNPVEKPLSKLQAKMLAARQAKATATAASPSAGSIKAAAGANGTPGQGNGAKDDDENLMLAAAAAATDALFSASAAAPPPLHNHRPSAFASLLVSPKRLEAPAQLVCGSTDLAHAETLAGFADASETLEDLRRAFEALSPDDIVAEKRKGTAVGSRLADGPVIAGGKGRK